MQRRTFTIALAVTAAIGLVSAANAEITGAGSTFIFPVLSMWTADYHNMGGEQINYQAIG